MGLMRSAQALFATLLGLARTRLELLSVEMQEVLARLVLIMVGAVAASPSCSPAAPAAVASSASASRTTARRSDIIFSVVSASIGSPPVHAPIV